MKLGLNTKDFLAVYVLFFTVNVINACQEKQTKKTPQEMLQKGLIEGKKKGFQLVQQAIKEGVDVNVNIDGYLPLIEAAFYQEEEIFKLLLDAKAIPDIQNKRGDIALTWAAQTGNDVIARLLLNANANPDIKTGLGTALTLAVRNRNKKIVQLLLNSNADLNIREGDEEESFTALDVAKDISKCKPDERIFFNEIIEMIEKEAIRRKQIIQKEAGEYLPDVLANIVSEYVVSCPK